MKVVVLYETSNFDMDKLMAAFPKHKALEEEFVNAKRVLGIGPFGVPGEGAMAIFIDKTSAEEFVSRDPFVQEKLVSKVIIKEWADVHL